MTKRYVHLSFNSGATWALGYRPMVEKFFSENADDWFRVNSETYILWTNAELNWLALGIQRLPGLQHFTVFASEFVATHFNATGLMPEEFWTWLYKWRQLG
jgi:hypothetical protein